MSETELTLSRVIDAPRDRVFTAYVDPEQFAAFWAPAGMSIPLETVTIEPHADGALEAVILGPDGTEYPMKARYLDVVEPERIVFTVPASGLVSDTTFKDLGDRTEVVVHQTNVDPARKPDTEAGLKGSFDRLAALLAA